MIISYMAIPHDGGDPLRETFETARAALIRNVAAEAGVTTHMNHDGDASYLEAYIDLDSLVGVVGPPEDYPEDHPSLDHNDHDSWSYYTDFLRDLEDLSLGYLMHEVHTPAEMALVQTLGPAGASGDPGDAPSLANVNVDYRQGHEPTSESAPSARSAVSEDEPHL